MDNSADFGPSELGKLDYWEDTYALEIENFEDHGDVGNVWFGKSATSRVVQYITEILCLPKNASIVDVGCGNGMTLVDLANNGFTNLLGIDYSTQAILLAEKILKQFGVSNIVKLKVLDIVNCNQENKLENIHLIHDKGTYDAISMNPDHREENKIKYIENVANSLMPEGYFVITSCNWTKDELIQQFSSSRNQIIIILNLNN